MVKFRVQIIYDSPSKNSGGAWLQNDNTAPACTASKKAKKYSGLERTIGREVQLLRANELKSITALIAYIAHEQGVNELTVCAMLASALDVNDVANIPSREYDAAIKFLVDLNINESIN